MPAYPDWFRGWPGKEAEATELRWYEPLIVPGLLQTEAYARTLLRTRVGVTEDEFEAMLAARLERQVILARPKPPTLWVLLDEGVLHRPVGDAQVMHEQVSYLAAAARRPNIVVQVVPRSVGAYEGLRGPLVLASFAGGPEWPCRTRPCMGRWSKVGQESPLRGRPGKRPSRRRCPVALPST
jgi:hypothetical protein